MKRLLILLVIFSSLFIPTPVPASAISTFHYENTHLGFSVTIPEIREEDVIVEESGTCVSFFHALSYKHYGGLIGSIEVVSPRSKFFSGRYDNMAYQIIAMGENEIYLWRSPSGGVETNRELLDSFRGVSAAFSVGNLREGFTPTHLDDWLVLQSTHHLAYLSTDGNLVRPDAPLTRGEFAEMLYTLLDADNKDKHYSTQFLDITGKDCSQAVSYLESYGILSGYADGTFRPDESISRAAFAVLLHRSQFAAPAGQYGEDMVFADVPADYWAEKYIYSAEILGWMHGGSDGLFHPMREITRSEAVTAINRMLGREESKTAVVSMTSPFVDLEETHWAYANILEATGVLADSPSMNKGDSLPEKIDVYYFVSEKVSWAMDGAQLRYTADGGKNWEVRGKPFSFSVSGLFFFDDQNGILLGNSEDSNCILFRTSDGGQSWDNLLEKPSVWAAYFPMERFPTERVLMDSIVSTELRPAGTTAVYLTIRYHPYESIYVYDFEAVWQATISAEQLLT